MTPAHDPKQVYFIAIADWQNDTKKTCVVTKEWRPNATKTFGICMAWSETHAKTNIITVVFETRGPW